MGKSFAVRNQAHIIDAHILFLGRAILKNLVFLKSSMV